MYGGNREIKKKKGKKIENIRKGGKNTLGSKEEKNSFK